MDRGWDGWMASLTQWTWVWVNSGSWWWTGRPGVLQSMGSQGVRHDWVTELNTSSEYSGLISFRIDWFDFLAVQGTLKSFLQHHNSKALVLWCSAFFMVQLSDDYNSLWCKLLSCTLGSISFWKVLSLWALLQSRNRLLSWYKTTLIFSESDFMLWVPRTVLVYILYTFASPCILNLYQSSIY